MTSTLSRGVSAARSGRFGATSTLSRGVSAARSGRFGARVFDGGDVGQDRSGDWRLFRHRRRDREASGR